MTRLADLLVPTVGEPRFDSPLADFIADRQTNEHYVAEDDRVILHDTVQHLTELGLPLDAAPSFEPGGLAQRAGVHGAAGLDAPATRDLLVGGS